MSCISVSITPTGGTGTELVNATGIVLAAEGNESLFPIPTYEETFVSSPDTEGERRVRSRPQNITGSGQVYLTSTSAAGLRTLENNWEGLIEQLRRVGGSMVYTPESGSAITYEIVSARLVTMSQAHVDIGHFRTTSTFELVYSPFGLLPETTLVTNANGTRPLLEFDVPAFDGSVDCLGFLSLKDTATQERHHLEGGLEATYYDSSAPWPLFVAAGSLTGISGGTAYTRSGAWGGTTIRNSIGTASEGIASYTSTHVGRFHAKARFYTTAGTFSARLGYAIRGGGTAYRPWTTIPGTAWREVDLGVVSIDEPLTGNNSVTFSVHAKRTASTGNIELDYVKWLPSERYWLASGDNTVRSGGTASVRHDAILTTTSVGVWAQHPNASGSYLRIPNTGGTARIAVSLNRNDIGTAQHTPLGDSMRADLTVIPRVALLGE